jgi:hypothetical protein
VYCLTELNWYRRPTEERLADEAFRSGKSVTKVDVRQEKRSCERSIGDSPPAKRGSIKDTPMNTESVVKVASIVLVTESQISISLKEWKTLRVLKLVGSSEVSISFDY